MATRPTFWAKALHGKEPKSGATAVETMSARRPCGDPLGVDRVPTISPMARMSAVVSVMITRITMVIETIAADLEGRRAEVERSWGRRRSGRSPTLEKSAMPKSGGDDGADDDAEQDGQPGKCAWSSRLITRMIEQRQPGQADVGHDP